MNLQFELSFYRVFKTQKGYNWIEYEVTLKKPYSFECIGSLLVKKTRKYLILEFKSNLLSIHVCFKEYGNFFHYPTGETLEKILNECLDKYYEPYI